MDFTRLTRVPVRVALPRRVRRSLAYGGAPHSSYRAVPAAGSGAAGTTMPLGVGCRAHGHTFSRPPVFSRSNALIAWSMVLNRSVKVPVTLFLGHFHGAAQHMHIVHFCATLFGRHRGPSPGRAWHVGTDMGGGRRAGVATLVITILAFPHTTSRALMRTTVVSGPGDAVLPVFLRVHGITASFFCQGSHFGS